LARPALPRRVPRARSRRCAPKSSAVNEILAATPPYIVLPLMVIAASKLADKVIPGEDVVQMQQKMERERMEKKLKARKQQQQQQQK